MSYNHFNTNGRVQRNTNRLFKIGTMKVYAPSKVEARRRYMVHHGTTVIKKGAK